MAGENDRAGFRAANKLAILLYLKHTVQDQFGDRLVRTLAQGLLHGPRQPPTVCQSSNKPRSIVADRFDSMCARRAREQHAVEIRIAGQILEDCLLILRKTVKRHQLIGGV